MHPNTRLTLHSRKKMVHDYLRGKSVTVLAQELDVSRKTCYVWLWRFREAGLAGLSNRSSRPHQLRRRLSAQEAAQLLTVRQERRWGPLRLAGHFRIPVATVYRALRRAGQHRLAHAPREPVRRYEAKAPGALVHLDVLHLFALRGRKPIYQFTVVDDYTRQAYALLAPKRTSQAAWDALLAAEVAFGYRFQAVLTDNDVTFTLAARPDLWPRRQGAQPSLTRFGRGCQARGIRHRLTQVRRPQTNGKVERFHRTIREECWRPQLFASEEEREQALQSYLHYYNHERGHTALGGQTPDQRRDAYLAAQGVLPTS